jgi:hypothetical protein
VGYDSTSDLTVHFGLRDARRAEVEVRWPSAIVQHLGEVDADQRLQVTEPGS